MGDDGSFEASLIACHARLVIIKHCNLEMKLRLEFFTLPKITFQRVEQREAIIILTCFAEKKCQNVPEFLASKS